MENNSGENGLAKSKDVDEVTQLSSGKCILEKFLNTASRVESTLFFRRKCMIILHSL